MDDIFISVSKNTDAEEYGHTRETVVLLFILYNWYDNVPWLVPGTSHTWYVYYRSKVSYIFGSADVTYLLSSIELVK